jgi:hypothetical protein
MKKGETFPAPHVGDGNKWWSSSLSLILSELEQYTWSLRYWIWVTKMGAKTGRCHLGLLKSQEQ